MGYIISLPLISRGAFKTFILIPFPVMIGQSKFMYIETDNKLLYVEQARQYYYMTDRDELRRCKTTELNKYICKQTQPLLNSHMQESCAVKLLQPRPNIPKICDSRIVQLNAHNLDTIRKKK
jgi:hypothetical protein